MQDVKTKERSGNGESHLAPRDEVYFVEVSKVVMETVTKRVVETALDRHYVGKWGRISDIQRQANLLALRQGGAVVSIYEDAEGHRLRIISQTNEPRAEVLLEEEYIRQFDA